ncbi:MAG: MFS transporter [Chloroflexi bacterium]|nr:MFS transporter [Chloroflexota bacterium]
MERQESQQGSLSDVKADTKKSLKYFHGEAGIGAVQEVSNAYAPASMIAAGASAWTVAMLSTLCNFVAGLLYIKVPTVIQKMGSRKKAILFLAFLDAIGWLPLIAVLIFFRPINPLWLIPCWIVNLIPGMLLNPARSSWLADLIPPKSMGRYLGIRSAISGAVYIGTFYIMGSVLQIFDDQRLNGFAILFLVAFIATFSAFIIYSKIKNTECTADKDSNFGFFDFLQETRQRNLGRFILYVSTFQFAVYLAVPFITPFLLDRLHFSYIQYTLVFSSEFIAKVVIVTFWGKYADKVGNLKVIKRVALLIPLIPLLWLACHSYIYLVFVQLFSGVLWAGFELCTINFIYEAAPPGKRLKYISYHKSLSTLSMALGALAGALLLGVVRPVLGYKILALFVLSAVLRFGITSIMFPKIREVRGTMRSSLVTPLIIPAVTQAPINRPALFNNHREGTRSTRPFVAATIPVQPLYNDSAETGRGLYYRPRQWHMFSKPLMSEVSTLELRRSPISESIDYDVSHAQVQDKGEALAANWGLFYRPGEWTRFGRPQDHRQSYFTPTQNCEDIGDCKQGMFHRAKGWFKSNNLATNEESPILRRQFQPAPVLAR